MNNHLNPTLDPLGATWTETIAALPTPEEREEATRFIEHDLHKGAGTGILRGLFLLLKANRCYLENLPDQFRREMVQPLIENLLRIETGIAKQIEVQNQILNQMNRCFASASTSADRMEAVVPKIERVVQQAFDRIDSSKLTCQIESSVVEGAVKPVIRVNEQCAQLQDQLKERLPGLTSALKWLTIGNFVVWALSCALLIGAIALYVVSDMEREMRTQLRNRVREETEKVHATAQVNEETLKNLARLNVELIIAPEKDWFGNVRPNHYCVAMQGADSGHTVYKDGQRYGAIFFEEQITPISLYPR